MNNKEALVVKNLDELRDYVALQILDSLAKMAEISIHDNPSLSEVSSYKKASIHDLALEGVFCAFSNYIGDIVRELPADKYRSANCWSFEKYLSDNDIFETSEQEGGGVGGSEDCHTILKVGDRYFRFEYNYYSHHGYDIFGSTPVTEVKPRSVEVIKFFPA